MRVTTTDTPDTGRSITNALSNRPPLLPSPLAKLPLGSVRPRGWIEHQLRLMVDGQVGRLSEISKFLADDNGWFGTQEDGWEEQPYWFRGFYNLGVLTGDQRILRESVRWIEAVLSSQDEDGYFGPPVMKRVVGKNGRVVVDLWPHMIMLDALRSYYEVTGDPRVIELMTTFFHYCASIPEEQFVPQPDKEFGNWRAFIQTVRSGDMIPHIYWLHNLTGEAALLDLATRFHEHVSPPEGEFLCAHIVHFTQRFREPGNYYVQSRDPAQLEETERWYEQHMSVWGQQPGGVFGADECVRSGKTDPKQGFETCGMNEFNKSFYILAQATGQAMYADRVEDIIFNSYPVSQTPNLKALHYLTAANQPQLDASTNHDYFNKARQVDYSPHIYRCCQHNVAMGWPYYVEHMWMAAPGGGLAAWLYGACEVTAQVGSGGRVTIAQETDYPFDTSVRMTVSTGETVEFPLYLRVPRWCEGFAVRVNGEPAEAAPLPGQYVVIERAWADGDTLEIEMPVALSIRRWKESGAVTVDRGPLSYSLRIGEEWVKRGTGTDKWPDWEVYPATAWNYGLLLDEQHPEESVEVARRQPVADQPWTLENAPIVLRAKGRRIPNWRLIDETVTDLQPGPIRSSEPDEEIEMVPMGCARLRMACLPVIDDGPEAREWQVVESHDEAMQIRLSRRP